MVFVSARARLPLAAALLGVAVLAFQPPAQAHHLLEFTGLQPSPLTGFLSGLAHPVIGPDHLLFLLALSLAGLLHRGRWMLALLAAGLTGSAVGLVLPGLPAQELWLALTLLLEAVVLLQQRSVAWLLPAIALHGYALSASVLGWSSAPVAFYLLGLLLSQGALLTLALTLLQRSCAGLAPRLQRALPLALLPAAALLSLQALRG